MSNELVRRMNAAAAGNQPKAQEDMPDKAVAATNTVTVACKLPHGMHLDLIDNNGVRVRRTVAGNNSRNVFGGYGLTADIPADFWEEWLKQNSQLDMVKKNFIFAYNSFDGARRKAEEQAEIRHGVEPINPDPNANDRRFPKHVLKEDKGEN